MSSNNDASANVHSSSPFLQAAQNVDARAFELSVEELITKSNHIRKSIEDFLAKLDNEHAFISWPSMLDNYALISGQISTLMATMKSEKMSNLRLYPIIPLKLSQDQDQHLGKLTGHRVSCLSHAEVPDYLRTKPDPAVEQAEQQLLSSSGAAATTDISSVNTQTQISSFNKQCNRVLEKVRHARANSKAESVITRPTQATGDHQTTMNLIAMTTYGHGLNLQQHPSGMMQMRGNTS